jgi:hypothetical protein
MATVNLGSSVTLKEFAEAIATVGSEVTIIGQGEPGIGKSAMLKVLGNRFEDHETAYIDCTLLDLGDFALPYTVEENGVRVTRFAPNARFKFQSGKPVIIMLDEIGKAIKSVKNVLLTLMNEHRIGDQYLPKGSIVFGTTNLASDGVGDSLEAHARNRVCFTTVMKPHAGFNADGTVDEDSWGMWALENDIEPLVIAYVKQYPQCLESYTDPAQQENGRIFHPTRAGQSACVTPRSLEKSSHIVKRRSVLGHKITMNLLAGTVGETAAKEMEAFFTVVDKLPTWESIVADPKNAKLPGPTDVIAKCLTVFSALSRVDAKTLDPWLDYVQRMDMEWQALFAKSGMKSKPKQEILIKNDKFKKWATTNQWAF